MIAQSGESVGGYALKEPKLIYESIESPEMYSQAAADYTKTEFPFMDVSYLKPTNWLKDQTSVVETINVPRRSMRAIVILFKHADTEDSEDTFTQTSRKSMSPSTEDPTRFTATESLRTIYTERLKEYFR